MKNIKLVNVLCTVAILGTFSCTKNNDSKTADTSPAANTLTDKSSQQEVEKSVVNSVKNETNSKLIKISDTKYVVMPPSMILESISLANNPIKSTCKELSKLSHEIEDLESKKTEAIALASEDFSAEEAVDELVASLETLNSELDSKKSETFKVSTVYSKEQLLKNIEILKKSNPEINFELKQPEKILLSVKSKENKYKAEQFFETSETLKEGAFDEAESTIKINLDVNYDILCTLKSANTNIITKSDRAELEMKFQD